jgi:CBS domain-containing protein
MKKPAPRAAEIMDRDPITVSPSQVVRQAAECMWKGHCPAAVLVDERHRPLGILSQQGLILALLDIVNHGMPPGPPKIYADPGLVTVDEMAGLLPMAELFVRKGAAVRALAVVRAERLVGLVLRRDVVHAVMDYLTGVEDVQQRVLYLSALRKIDEAPSFD